LRLGIVVDLRTGPTLEDVAKKILPSQQEQAEKGHLLKSISHAVDPNGGDECWSVLMLYQEIGPEELRA
jgi:hypothetical protein